MALAAGYVPADPASFVGPPVPLGILFAPATVPATAGLVYQIEAPPSPPGVSSLRPVTPVRLRMLWDPDVQAELREVPNPGGGYAVHLRGAYLDLATISIDDDGRPVLHCAPSAAPPARPAGRPRAGRE